VACLFISPLPTAGLTFAGWTMGLVFHATKRWRQRGPARTLLQVAGVFVGLVVGSQVLAALALRQVLPGSPSAGVSQQVLGYLVLPIGVWGIVLIEAAQTRDVLAERLSQPRYHPDGAPAVDNPEIRTRLEHLAREAVREHHRLFALHPLRGLRSQLQDLVVRDRPATSQAGARRS
jgi:hypothetical protein